MNQVDLTRAFRKKIERAFAGIIKPTFFQNLDLTRTVFRRRGQKVNRIYLFLSKPYWEAELEFSSRTFVFVNYAALQNFDVWYDRLNQLRLPYISMTKRKRFMGSCTKPRAKDPSLCSSSFHAFGYVIESEFSSAFSSPPTTNTHESGFKRCWAERHSGMKLYYVRWLFVHFKRSKRTPCEMTGIGYLGNRKQSNLRSFRVQ